VLCGNLEILNVERDNVVNCLL